MANAKMNASVTDSKKLSYLMACESMWKKFKYENYFQHPLVISTKHLSHDQVPCTYVWNKSKHTWIKKNISVDSGSLYKFNPNFGEIYYLRLLIDHVKGSKNYEDFLTFNGKVYKTFKESCAAHGLLDGDEEWHDTMVEAASWSTSHQLRQVFTLLLVHCEISCPLKLWNAFWKYMSADIANEQKKLRIFEENDLQDADSVFLTLIEIELLLCNYNSSLLYFPDLFALIS